MSKTALILKALDFAAHRHRKQFRKGELKVPYINHPIEVASLLANEGGEEDPVLLTAAILHDVIEDTVDSVAERDSLIEEIRDLFGEEILSVTLEVTDDQSLDKQERKRLQVTEAPHKSDAAKKLKIADKIMNVRDIIINPPAEWPRTRIIAYLGWAEEVVAGLRGVSPGLESMFDKTLKKARSHYKVSGSRG
jgi:GTP diphosphokinase / guanosine-3',5'-bis(diphosphate) 3'-diphosphatase